MLKNNKATKSLVARSDPKAFPDATPLAEGISAVPTLIPKDLSDLLNYVEGSYGDDEGRFDATILWPWRNLTSNRRNLNERILRIILKRLLTPKGSLDQHWKRLHADVQQHRRNRKAQGKLANANVADIVLSAIVDALLPVKEVPAKELKSILHNTSQVAAELYAHLSQLRNIGVDIERFLPTEETIDRDDQECGGREYGGAYANSRFFIQAKLPSSLPRDQREDITEYALRVVMGDPWVTMGILARVATVSGLYKVKRHNLSGRQRFAYVMATHMVHDSIKFFGVPRYERAEAFAKAASGFQIKGLRQMMEREKRLHATKGDKKRPK